jgi:uncharacterized damage-inducible protein DinB
MTVDFSRVPPFYHNYIGLVKEENLMNAFHEHQKSVVKILKILPEEKWNYRYEQNKWTIKDMVQHLIDAERIFCYRALRFSRKDKTELPGFDENTFALSAEAHRRTGKDLIEELSIVQDSSAQLFASFSSDQLSQSGIANGKSVYVEAIGFIIIGHALHHLKILRERYGLDKDS